MMAKARFKEPSTSLETANGLLFLNGSGLGSPTGCRGCKCCWACWPLAGWGGELKRAAAGFSEPLGWVVDEFSMVDWREDQAS